uniref:ornithine decarboxylase n=1 Tax=Anoplophora glabripennis TaxID=217634 RepID=V5GTY5_ANOGL
MKIVNSEENVHILDSQENVWSVIRDIAYNTNQEEAFYICDVGDLVRKHKIWKTKLPRVEPHYAVKCNDSMTVLEVLNTLGAGFDCASKAEINKVLSLDVRPNRIIFANPAKPASHIRHAASVGVSRMTFDNEMELHKVKKLYPDAEMVIRIRSDALEARCPLGMKFGCNPVTEAPELLRIARSLDINVIGVSFHVGSGCGEPQAFRRAIAASRDVFDYASTLGYQFHLLDIGGGYPGGRDTSIDEIAEIINAALDDYFPDPCVQVISEPGRFYVTSAYTLACNIYSIRKVVETDPETGKTRNTHNMYYINDGVYGSFNCILYDQQVIKPHPLKEYPGAKYRSSSIWGPTCDSLDQVVENIMLPEMKIGDWLVFEDMGAYTLPVASPFNGFPIPKVHVIAEESIWVLLKDLLTLSDDHFQMLKVPSKNKEEDYSNYTLPSFPIRIEIPRCNDSSMLGEYVLDYSNVLSVE